MSKCLLKFKDRNSDCLMSEILYCYFPAMPKLQNNNNIKRLLGQISKSSQGKNYKKNSDTRKTHRNRSDNPINFRTYRLNSGLKSTL